MGRCIVFWLGAGASSKRSVFDPRCTIRVGWFFTLDREQTGGNRSGSLDSCSIESLTPEWTCKPTATCCPWRLPAYLLANRVVFLRHCDMIRDRETPSTLSVFAYRYTLKGELTKKLEKQHVPYILRTLYIYVYICNFIKLRFYLVTCKLNKIVVLVFTIIRSKIKRINKNELVPGT